MGSIHEELDASSPRLWGAIPRCGNVYDVKVSVYGHRATGPNASLVGTIVSIHLVFKTICPFPHPYPNLNGEKLRKKRKMVRGMHAVSLKGSRCKY